MEKLVSQARRVAKRKFEIT